MNVSLTPDLERFVKDQIASGRFRSASEVVGEGLRLLAGSSQGESDRRTTLQCEVDAGLLQVNEGKVRVFDADRVKQRARDAAKRAK